MSRTILPVLAALCVAGAPASAASMNPDTSVNVLGLYSQSKRQGQEKTEPGGGFSLQEAEIQFQADVDPFLKATVTIAIEAGDPEAPEVDATAPATEPKPGSKAPDYAAEPEEAFFETTKLPLVSFKVGKFKAALGRHNTLHSHAFPFIDAPLVNLRLLGDEGLADAGISAALLAPLPWFVELTAQVIQGNSEVLFASESSSDVAEVLRLRNLFDLSDSATLDLGVSGAAGANAENGRTRIGGADASFKWRPTKGGKYSALIVAAEYLSREDVKGYAGWVQVQVAERWWVQVRNEEVADEPSDLKAKKNTALVAFNPSEFSGFRLQVDRLDEGGEANPIDTVQLQTNFTIGAHPAHAY